MGVPSGLAQIIAAYGDPGYANGEVSPAWEEANMILVTDFPLVATVKPKLYINRKIEAPLRSALAACEALGDGYALKSIGCFAPRAQRGSSGLLSTHTWGVAVDVNADDNPLLSPSDLDDPRRLDLMRRTIPDAWVAAFEAAGFFWGGNFHRRYDPMHFQLCTGY